jgi:hypothetical protein
MQGKLLFAEYDLFALIQGQEKAAREEIANIPADALAQTSVEELTKAYGEKCSINIPTLNEAKIEIKQEEISMDVSRRMDMMFMNAGSHHRPGVRYSFFVPFTGDANIFRCRASQYSLNPPRAEIRNSELVITHDSLTSDVEPAKATLKSTLENIKSSLQWAKNDAAKFNSNLEGIVRGALVERQSKLSEHAQELEKSGFKVRR